MIDIHFVVSFQPTIRRTWPADIAFVESGPLPDRRPWRRDQVQGWSPSRVHLPLFRDQKTSLQTERNHHFSGESPKRSTESSPLVTVRPAVVADDRYFTIDEFVKRPEGVGCSAFDAACWSALTFCNFFESGFKIFITWSRHFVYLWGIVSLARVKANAKSPGINSSFFRL